MGDMIFFSFSALIAFFRIFYVSFVRVVRVCIVRVFQITLMSMLMSRASVDFFVLSFVLPCAYAYAYVASEDISNPLTSQIFPWFVYL